MKRQPVTSSNLASVGYDAPSRILEIEFHSGGTYQYSGVPGSVHSGLVGAASKGSYFAQNIKNVYPYKKV